MKSISVKIVSFLELLVLSAALHAQTDGNSPYKEVKGQIILSQFRTIDNTSAPEGIFLNALLWEINRTEPQKEGEEETVLKKEWEKLQRKHCGERYDGRRMYAGHGKTGFHTKARQQNRMDV